MKIFSLAEKDKLMILLAVLLDGEAAVVYLSAGSSATSDVQEACKELCSMEPDLRVALCGTLLREVAGEL